MVAHNNLSPQIRLPAGVAQADDSTRCQSRPTWIRDRCNAGLFMGTQE